MISRAISVVARCLLVRSSSRRRRAISACSVAELPNLRTWLRTVEDDDIDLSTVAVEVVGPVGGASDAAPVVAVALLGRGTVARTSRLDPGVVADGKDGRASARAGHSPERVCQRGGL